MDLVFPARQMPSPAVAPLALDRDPSWEAEVERISATMDWDAVLPPRAGTAWYRLRLRIKRVMDVVGAGLALVLLAPLFALVAFLVTRDGGPVFYPWRVVGRRGRPFTGYKFRTMVSDADQLKDQLQHLNEMTGPVFKIRNDPRVTRVGRFLRRHSIDELPQVWSVLKGDMSLVGPRPPSAREFAGFEPHQRGKIAVTPGLTCLWQVYGRSHITDFAQWAALDLEYIRSWSLWLDVRIILRTVWVVVRGSGGY